MCSNSVSQHYDLLILGSGPAGCSAAIYAARTNYHAALLSGVDLGGQLSKTAKIANWPGEKAIAGAALMERMLEQVQALPIDLVYDSATNLDLMKTPFEINCHGANYLCDALILATGSYPRLLGLKNERTYLGRGVSTCATCDGFFYRAKEVAVVGGGNSMASTVFYLAQIASKVHVLHHSDHFKVAASELMHLQALPNVIFHNFTEITEYIGDGKLLQGLKLRNLKTMQEERLAVDGCFLSIGYVPNTDLFKSQLVLKDEMLVVGYQNINTQSSIQGVFAAGDLVYGLPKQAIVAAGWGCMAALDATQYLYYLKNQ